MSYDLSPQVIEQRRLAYDELTRRYGQREATRYEEATIGVQHEENFHYRPLWNPAIEIYDPSMTRLKLADWYSFLDPRQFYYGPYNQARNKSMENLDSQLAYANERAMLDKIAGDWRNIFLSYLLPLRHYEYGGTTVMTYVARFAYGTSIEQCASFNAFDKTGNSQIITKFALMLPNADQLLEEGKRRWMEAPHLQPLRSLVEHTWLITDWAEAIFVQNLLLDPLLYTLLYQEFDRVALENGALAVTFIHKYMNDWLKDNSRWTTALVEAFLNDDQHGEANRQAIQQMLDGWRPKVEESLRPLGVIFEMPQVKGNFEASWQQATQNLDHHLERLGLNVATEMPATNKMPATLAG
ncbi:MAG: hypothetical protein JWP00_2544 [Chloroflexi bacterium]|jgi:phenol hydroxylase P1 protein|nr:hypothetical protein [Chloroflexota bacterium]